MSDKLDGQARCRALLTDPTLVKGGRIEPVWADGGERLVFVERSGDAPVVKAVASATGALLWSLDPAGLVGEAGAVAVATGPSGELILTAGAGRFALDAANGGTRELLAEETAALGRLAPQPTRAGYPTVFPPEMEALSPDRTWFLTLKDHDIWLRPVGEGDERRISTGGVADPRWSTQGAAWSPDSRRIALMRVDERAIHRVPLVDWTADVATVAWHVYPRADGAIQVSEVFLADAETGEVTRVGGGDADHYAFIFGFSADGRRLRHARLERRSKYVEIFEYDVAAGRNHLLLREASETFLYWTPTFILQGPPIRLLSDGRFLWQSERSGWNQIYLHDADGSLIRQLTKGEYPVTGIVGVDAAERTLFYRAQPDPDRPYDAQIFRTDLETAAQTQLSTGLGVHEASLAPNGAAYVETHSAPDRPPQSELRAPDGRLLATLSRADASGLGALGWRPPEAFVAKAADGETDLHGLIYTPADFDPARSYPVVEYIYAGAQSIHTAHVFGPGPCSAFAQLGFVFIALDGRGTPGRGKAFQDVVVGRLGDYEIADHAGAIRQAAAIRPWMDLSRVGIFGVSFGGYFTVRALIQAPELYKAGVALAPAELGPGIMTMPVESYIGLPDDDPERYQAVRNADKVEAIAGELLIITGTDDVNTPIDQTMAYAKALIAAGKPFDEIVIPGVNHLFVDAAGGSQNLFVYTAVMRHLARTLGQPGARP
jgi:dipeptidyl aminopeptidase/acylaminoacyl peptidase